MEHYHIQLKKDYEHLMSRTWDLFKEGKRQEGILKTAVVNAWKYLGVIEASNDIDEIKTIASQLRELMSETMEKTREQNK